MIVRTPAMLRRLLGRRAVAGRDPVELAREAVVGAAGSSSGATTSRSSSGSWTPAWRPRSS
ncbi:hypothetical protein [Blastococcus brunescens]|uniref:Nitroreductase domain-containing protein n=1 Tax=Blastococcus brunescens TaxID=1564165 RepID=A0ABZ1AXF8_9ACTN|nr:hypothetical protein [Blastococcus sp. BMG 8361]WRL63185.1 hypothetical protein U6N30_25885 [Blastococcus sp. BMG 8361]